MVSKQDATTPASVRQETIPIAQLVLDHSFQVRTKLNGQAIAKYKEAYLLKGQLPPIRAAEIDGMMILVDGWHRVTALQQLGWLQVDVQIEPMSSKADAKWAASIANVTHGVPLSKEDEMNVFKNYIMVNGSHNDQGERMIGEWLKPLLGE